MERLTIQTEKGAALKMADSYESESAARQDLMVRYRVAVARLAQYEDKGLEPEEAMTAKEMAEVACALNLLKEYQSLGSVEHFRELSQAEKIHALKRSVCKYCSRFMQMQTYGECRAACPFHAVKNHGQFMCVDRFIEENPEKVAKILGIAFGAEAELNNRERREV